MQHGNVMASDRERGADALRYTAALNARVARLEAALKIAMKFMPHGPSYEGPVKLRHEDVADWLTCKAALLDTSDGSDES